MKNTKMYLTEAEAKAANLPSNEEQIARYNAALKPPMFAVQVTLHPLHPAGETQIVRWHGPAEDSAHARYFGQREALRQFPHHDVHMTSVQEA